MNHFIFNYLNPRLLNVNLFSYEPELHPGVTYKLKNPKATLKIFSTGSITITAPSVKNVQAAVEHIYGLVEQFQKPKTIQDLKSPLPEVKRNNKRKAESSSLT